MLFRSKDGFVLRKFKIQEEDGSYSDDTYTEAFGPKAFGALFFAITGFHGFHVTVGTLMLIVIWVRCLKGHFKPEHHFGFEGVAWYWHFVDVVWLGLFIFVYWL